MRECYRPVASEMPSPGTAGAVGDPKDPSMARQPPAASQRGLGLALVGASASPSPVLLRPTRTGNHDLPRHREPGKFVVLTVDASTITQQGHGAHQDERDVIPPFEYVAEHSTDRELPGPELGRQLGDQGEGVATEPVDKADCGPGEEPSPSPTPTVTVTVTPTATTTVTVTPTPTMTVTPTPTMTAHSDRRR